MLKKTEELDEFHWIWSGIEKLAPSDSKGWNGNRVTHCIPPLFEDYCKILHPIYLDTSKEVDEELTWDVAERCDKLRENNVPDPISALVLEKTTLTYGTLSIGEENAKRIRWKDLADQYGLKFHSEINVSTFTGVFKNSSWPRHILGPDEGQLELGLALALADALKPFTEGQKCYFGYDLISTKSADRDLLYFGSLDDIVDTTKLESVWGSPTYWWPENRKWCVCTSWDLTFTIVGGKRELVNRLISHPEIEAIRVQPDSRIDWRGDKINTFT